jgi:hypothetical protein
MLSGSRNANPSQKRIFLLALRTKSEDPELRLGGSKETMHSWNGEFGAVRRKSLTNLYCHLFLKSEMRRTLIFLWEFILGKKSKGNSKHAKMVLK